MGLFSLRARGTKTPNNAKREAKSTKATGSGDSPGEDRNQSRKSTPLAQSSQANSAHSTPDQGSRERESASDRQAGAQGGNFMATIGQSIVFKGELAGDEDLEIEGEVEGSVDLKSHQLTIGANGNLKAEVIAKSIIVIGQVKGNLTATERIEVQATGVVEGDIKAPRLNVQDGAVLNGTIDMSPSSVSEAKKSISQSAPTTATTATTSATAATGSPSASSSSSAQGASALKSA